MLNTDQQTNVEDSGTVEERRPHVPTFCVQCLNPVLSGFCLWDFSTQTDQYWLSLQEADIERD